MTLQAPRPLSDADLLTGFDSGVASLDLWLIRTARRAQRGHTAETYVVVNSDAQIVAGYYCLSASSVARALANGWLARNTPDPIPVILLGRLAVDSRYQGIGLGASLLRDAANRATQASRILGARALLVDAIDETAAAFYRKHMFEPFAENPLRLYHRL